MGQSRARDLSSMSNDTFRERKFALSLVICREKSGVLTCRGIGCSEPTFGDVEGRFDSLELTRGRFGTFATDFVVREAGVSTDLLTTELFMPPDCLICFRAGNTLNA